MQQHFTKVTMSSKCSLYIQGEWCQLDTKHGTVRDPSNEIHRPRFYYIHSGQLRGLPPELVLQELRAYHTAQPSKFVEGTPLPRNPCPFKRERGRRKRRSRDRSRCGNSRERSKSPSRARCQGSSASPHTQVFHKHNSPGHDCRPIPTKDASKQIAQRHADSSSTSGEDSVKRAAQGTGRTAPSSKQTDDMKQHVSPSKQTRVKTEDEVPIKSRLIGKRSPAKRKRIESDSSTLSQSSGSQVESAREQQMTFIKLIFGARPQMKGGDKDCGLRQRKLRVAETDVMTLRDYIASSISDVDDDNFLYRFDNDEKFKLKLFYKINPLVNVERCPRITEMLACDESHVDICLKHFAGKLGLRHVEYATPERCRTRRDQTRTEDLSKENQTELIGMKEVRVIKPILKKRAKSEHREESRRVRERDESVNTGANDSGSDTDFVTKKVTKNKQNQKVARKQTRPARRARGPAHAGGFREYSPLEDQAILSWLVAGGTPRERSVNGNKIWRQLQDQYPSLTGCCRSWHSLRNRYLRYILPELGCRDVPLALAARLRAHAALGEMKNGKRSVAAQPTVVSAWSLRPRAPPPPRSPSPRSIPSPGGEAPLPLDLQPLPRPDHVESESPRRRPAAASSQRRSAAASSQRRPAAASPQRRSAAASPRRRAAAASPRRRAAAASPCGRAAAAASPRRRPAAASPPPARRKLYNPKAM